VRDWIAYYGVYFNINPDPHPFRGIHCGGANEPPMTSLERERRGPLRPGMVRERLLEHFARVFRCERTSLFSEHPFLTRRPATGTVTAHS
jgi:lipoate-protein ligase B